MDTQNKPNENSLSDPMLIEKILDLVFSSKRTMPAHFYSQGNRKQTFGINFDPLDADTDYEMANTAHNISSMFYSAIPDLNKEEHSALLKYGEDIMLGAFIVCSIDKKDMSKDLQEEIIKENTNLFEDRIPERIPELLKNSNVSHAFDYYRYVGEQFAEGNRNFFEPPKFNSH